MYFLSRAPSYRQYFLQRQAFPFVVFPIDCSWCFSVFLRNIRAPLWGRKRKINTKWNCTHANVISPSESSWHGFHLNTSFFCVRSLFLFVLHGYSGSTAQPKKKTFSVLVFRIKSTITSLFRAFRERNIYEPLSPAISNMLHWGVSKPIYFHWLDFVHGIRGLSESLTLGDSHCNLFSLVVVPEHRRRVSLRPPKSAKLFERKTFWRTIPFGIVRGKRIDTYIIYHLHTTLFFWVNVTRLKYDKALGKSSGAWKRALNEHWTSCAGRLAFYFKCCNPFRFLGNIRIHSNIHDLLKIW